MKRTPGRTSTDRARYWTKHIEQARVYNAGVTAYCKLRGIEKNTYYHYFRKLRALHPEWVDLNEKQMESDGTEGAQSGEVNSKSRKRTYSARYKRNAVKEYDSLPEGAKGAFLRREGLYASHISKWRNEPDKRNDSISLAAENAALKAKLAKAEKKLETTQKLLGLQKKKVQISWAWIFKRRASKGNRECAAAC